MTNKCGVCGRSDRKINNDLCPRHEKQLEEYGEFLDMNARDSDDTNEIIIKDDWAEIILYDELFNELDEKVIIDLEDVDLVEGIIWRKQGNSIVGQANQYFFKLPNLLMDSNEKINYINDNIYDNRKINLDVLMKRRQKHSFHKKHKDRVIVTGLGGSLSDVTGSCFSVEYSLDNGNRDLILIECGGIQTNRIMEDYHANKKMVDRIPFNLASNIFILHSHADHIANLPSGITRGFGGSVISNYKNSEIMKPMLLDGAFIHNRNVSSLKNKGKDIENLYEESDVYSILSKINVYDECEIHKVNNNLSFRFLSNNHMVGSCSLELFIKKPSGRIVKIWYSSDIGSKNNEKYKPYVSELEIPSKSNVVVIESTYGESDRCFSKKEADKDVGELLDFIRGKVYKKNRVLIPTFSLDRAQSLMTLFYDTFKNDDAFKKVKVIVDSRLLNQINDVYRVILEDEQLDKWNEVMSWKNFIFVDEFKKTEIYAKEKDVPMVIISSSGMLSGGHSCTYAKYILPSRNDGIAFIGYCSPNTVGGRIQSGNNKTIAIDGVNVPIRCDIKIFHSFSGHIQKDELIKTMKQIKCDKIYIHHGSKDAKESLKFEAEEAFLFGDINNKKIHILDEKNNQIYL